MAKRGLWVAMAMVIFGVLLVGCNQEVVRGSRSTSYEKVVINTSDGVNLSAWYYPSYSEKGIILIHMAAKSKSSFGEIAPRLQEKYKVLAIDLRGHGDSDGNYEDLTDSNFSDMILDVEAAAQSLMNLGVARENISLAGASIGANLAITYAAQYPVDKLALISPGSRLRGIDITRIAYDKPLFIQVGHYDAYSSISVDELEGMWSKARVMKYDSPAHGTDLLNNDLSAREDFLFYLT